jgi:hypothetical protein
VARNLRVTQPGSGDSFQGSDGKLDLSLWTPSGDAFRPRAEFRMKCVPRRLRTSGGTEDQNDTLASPVRRNGRTLQQNTMEQHLSKVVDQHQRDWDRHLPLFLLEYRAAIHETTHTTPNACEDFVRSRVTSTLRLNFWITCKSA